MESISDTVLITSLDGTIVFWNKGAEEVFGYTGKEIVGTPVARLYSEDQRKSLAQLKERAIAGGRVVNTEIMERGKGSGSMKTILLSVVPIRDGNGRIQWLAGIGKDMTEFKRLQQEVVEAKKKETFHQMVVAMNHEMNQPLGVISSMVQVAGKQGGMPPDRIELVRQQVDRITDLVRRIREIKEVKVTEYVKGETMLDLGS